MSYSFSVRGATKSDAIAKVREEMDKVVATQPIHAADRKQAVTVATMMLGLVPLADGKDFHVYVSGSLGWSGTLDKDHVLTSASVNVSVSVANKE